MPAPTPGTHISVAHVRKLHGLNRRLELIKEIKRHIDLLYNARLICTDEQFEGVVAIIKDLKEIMGDVWEGYHRKLGPALKT